MDFVMRKFDPDELLCVRSKADGLVGEGSFGTVLLAFHAVHNAVALKCMEFFGGYNTIKIMEINFKLELENLQRCNHENVVRILGWAQWLNVFAMVMEYLPGGNLMELLAHREVDLPPLLQLRICSDIANGLSFIHNFSKKKRLVHGDIKPQNVLITMDLRCKISDFGSAKLSSYTGESTVTGSKAEPQNNQFTEFYAAPELLKSPLKKLHHSMDTYSYGMLVYVVLGRETTRVGLDLFKQSILKGDRPDCDDILNNKQVLEENGEEEEVRAMDALISAMEHCWKQLPVDRPTMLEIKEKLYAVVAEIRPDKILKDVKEAVREMEISIPLPTRYDCVPADQLQVFPDKKKSARNVVTSSSMPTSLTENTSAETFTSSSLLPSSSSAPASRATTRRNMQSGVSTKTVELVRSIKASLETQEVNEAVLKTVQLLEMDKSLPNSDVIIDDAIATARSLNDKSEHLTSLKMIGWASDICENIENQEVKFRKLYDCCLVVNDISRSMFDADMELYIEQYCLPLLTNFTEKLKPIKISDTMYKVKMESWSSLFVGWCNYRVGNNDRAIDIARSCLSIVMEQYGNEAQKLLVFSSCYKLLGAAYFSKGEYESAAECRKLQIEALGSVEDASKEKKKKSIKYAKQNLAKCIARIPSTE